MKNTINLFVKKNVTNHSNYKKQKQQNFMYAFLFLVLFLFSKKTVLGQENNTSTINTIQESFTVSGIVYNKTDNSPLPGTSIILKSKNIGIDTDMDGNFEIKNVKSGDIISIRFLGFENQDIVIKQQQPFMKIYLKEKPFQLLGAVETKATYKTKRSLWQRVKSIF